MILGLAILLGSRAAAADPPAPAARDCRALLARATFPGQTGESLVRTLYPSFDPTTMAIAPDVQLVGCDLRSWDAGSFVVMLEAVDAQHRERVEVARFDPDRGAPRLSARATDAVGVESVAELYVPHAPVGLDLADYRLAPGRRAIGLRVSGSGSCNGWNAYCERGEVLILLDAAGADLVPILRVQMTSEWATAHCTDPEESSCGRVDRRFDRMLVVQDQQTSGRYDLVVRNRKPSDEAPAEERFRWNGRIYVADAAAP